MRRGALSLYLFTNMASKRVGYLFWILAGLVLGLRLFYCASVPTQSTDAFRNLGYAGQFFSQGASLYQSLAQDFAPQAWANNWPGTGYIYPPWALLFFSAFRFLGLGIAPLKLVLTACDLIATVLFARYTNRWVGLLLFSAPTAIWWGSHEGQFESLQLLLMVLCLHFAWKGKWGWCGVFFGLGLQTKIISLLLAPSLLEAAWKGPKKISRIALMFVSGLIATVLPILPFYREKPSILLMPFLENTTVAFNPYRWDFARGALSAFPNTPWPVYWYGDSYMSWIFLFALVGTSLRLWASKDPGWRASLGALSFATLLKFLHWAQFWYLNVFPAFLLPMVKDRRNLFYLVVIFFFLSVHSIGLVLGLESSGAEAPTKVAEMSERMWVWPLQE